MIEPCHHEDLDDGAHTLLSPSEFQTLFSEGTVTNSCDADASPSSLSPAEEPS
jgi:hypothetical protein